MVECGGSAAGLQRFCEGVGEDTIDIANSSRPIREGEVETCAGNGVTDIIEVRIGYDGIVFASPDDGPAFAFTPEQWYNALAAAGRRRTAQLVANPLHDLGRGRPVAARRSRSWPSSPAPSTAPARSSRRR